MKKLKPENMIETHTGELTMTSLSIAKVANRDHRDLKKLVEKHIDHLAEVGRLPVLVTQVKRGTPAQVYHLNQYQVMFLLGEMRGDFAATARRNVSVGFKKLHKQTIALEAQRRNAGWIEVRKVAAGTTGHRNAQIPAFIVYCCKVKPDSIYATRPSMAYLHVESAIRATLFATTKAVRKAGYRSMLTPEQIQHLAQADRIAETTLSRGMLAGAEPKFIRKQIKADIAAWMALIGLAKSPVPDSAQLLEVQS